jgi:hypothetical protein
MAVKERQYGAPGLAEKRFRQMIIDDDLIHIQSIVPILGTIVPVLGADINRKFTIS